MALLAVLLQIVQTGTETATTAVQATDAQAETLSVFDLVKKGGPIMIPILGLSLVTFAIFFERYFFIRRTGRLDPDFLNQIKNRLYKGDVAGATTYCQKSNYPVARIIERGLIRMGSPVRDIEAAIENTARTEIYKMERSLPILSAIAAIAPMFGFLGTVVGMINAFYAISLSDNISIGVIAEGIYEKMVTSASGLIVGVIAYIAYTVLNMMIERAVHRMEITAVDFLDLLHKPIEQ